MSAMNGEGVSRRTMLGSCLSLASGALVARGEPTASALTASDPTTSAPAAGDAAPETIPTNPLGRTGQQVTRLAIGAGYPSYHARLLEHASRNGVRYFDNAYGYGNGAHERILGDWLARTGRRKDMFIVTKAGVCSTGDFYNKVTRALDNLQVDTIDMMLIHGIDDPTLPRDFWGDWRRLKEKLVRENKVRFMGFSTHATPLEKRIECVAEAAKSKWVDALMVACDPLMLRTNAALNRALDACVKAGVGLVAMKTTRGLGLMAAKRRGLEEGQAPTETMPGFEEIGLSGFGAIHAGMWSDGRFAAVCSAMLTRPMIDENTRNAREFGRPFDDRKWKLLEDGMRKLTRATCPGCDGACQRAAGKPVDFCSIARHVAYAEEDGNRAFARELYRRLPRDRRDAGGADLDAARRACPAHLDFAAILAKAQRWLA